MARTQRNQWITDRGLQLRFIAVLLFIGLLNFLFYILTLHFFFGEMRELMQGAQQVAGMTPSVDPSIEIVQRSIFYKAAIFGFMVQALLVLWLGIFFSNRIAGPIYRLNSVLKEIPLGGAVPVIKLRKHDFMVELTDNVNRALLHYSQFQTSAVDELQKLAADKKTPPEVATSLQELAARLKSSPPAVAE